jgi:hypothetical protein
VTGSTGRRAEGTTPHFREGLLPCFGSSEDGAPGAGCSSKMRTCQRSTIFVRPGAVAGMSGATGSFFIDIAMTGRPPWSDPRRLPEVSMTTTKLSRSRMPRKWHVRFCRRVRGVTHGLSQLACRGRLAAPSLRHLRYAFSVRASGCPTGRDGYLRCVRPGPCRPERR